MCISTIPAPALLTTASIRSSRAPVTSLTMQAPASSAAAATSGLRVHRRPSHGERWGLDRSLDSFLQGRLRPMELRARGPETGSLFAASSDRQTMGENAALLLPEKAAAAAETDDTEHEPVVVEEEPSADADRSLHLVPPDTFETFFEHQYTNLLRAMYLVTGNRHEAEEITQDAFVRALERWDRVRHADNRAGYLYRIAVNLYRSKLRRLARGARKTARPNPEADPFEA